MEDSQRVKLTGVELTGNAEIAALVDKAAAGHSGGERKRARGRQELWSLWPWK
jgi:hypothetical protein